MLDASKFEAKVVNIVAAVSVEYGLEALIIDKKFLVTVIATLRPGFIEELTNYALRARAEIRGDDEKYETLEISEEFQQALVNTHFVNRKFVLVFVNDTLNSVIVGGKRGKLMTGLIPKVPRKARAKKRNFPAAMTLKEYAQRMK